MIRSFNFFMAAILFITSCTSGRKAMQRGSYDEAVYKAVKRLRNNDKHKTSLQVLEQAYPLAQKQHLSRINDLQNSYDSFKWEPIAREYAILINLYDEISRCPACLTAVPSPVNYSLEYEQARLRAASDRYEAGLAALEKGKQGNRNEAKIAYTHFTEANYWLKGYKDTDERLKEAEQYATIHVVVEPIPMHSRALMLSNEFFDNKINEFLLHAPINRFVKFYTLNEARKLGINKPDQIIQLVFDDFVVGQTYLNEKEVHLVKDSIVLATYEVDVPVGSPGTPTSGSSGDNKITICHKSPGLGRSQTIQIAENAVKAHLDHGDKIGSCEGGSAASSNTKKETRKVYGQAKATLHLFTKTLESRGLLDFRILDGYTQRVISQEKFPGASSWQWQWGYYNGDERALENQHLSLIRNKEMPPPAPQDLFIDFTQPIYRQLTAKIKAFYSGY